MKDDLRKTFGFVPDDDMVAILIGVDEALLTRALDAVSAQWGGSVGYFEAALAAAQRAALRSLLVDR